VLVGGQLAGQTIGLAPDADHQIPNGKEAYSNVRRSTISRLRSPYPEARYNAPADWATAGRDRHEQFVYVGSRYWLIGNFLTFLTGLFSADYFILVDPGVIVSFGIIPSHERERPGQSGVTGWTGNPRVIGQGAALPAKDLLWGLSSVFGAFKGKGNTGQNRITFQAAKLYWESRFLAVRTEHYSHPYYGVFCVAPVGAAHSETLGLREQPWRETALAVAAR
jgi:hypothetical protein